MNSKFLVICVVFALAVGAFASYSDDITVIENRVTHNQEHALNGMSALRLSQLGYKFCAAYGKLCSCSGIMTYGHKGIKDARMVPYEKYNGKPHVCDESLNPHAKPSPPPRFKRQLKSVTVDVAPNPEAKPKDLAKPFSKDEKVGRWDIRIVKLQKPSVQDANKINSNPSMIEVDSGVVPEGFTILPQGFCMCKHKKDILHEKKLYIKQNAQVDDKLTRRFGKQAKMFSKIPLFREQRRAAQKDIYKQKIKVELVKRAALKLKRKVEKSVFNLDAVRMKEDVAKESARRYAKRMKRVKDNLFVLKDKIRNRKTHEKLISKEEDVIARAEKEALRKKRELQEATNQVILEGADHTMVNAQKDIEVVGTNQEQKIAATKAALDFKRSKLQLQYEASRKRYKKQLKRISVDRIKRDAAARAATRLHAKKLLVKSEVKNQESIFRKAIEEKRAAKKKVLDAKRKYSLAKNVVRQQKKLALKALKKYGRAETQSREFKIGFACCQQHMCNLIMNRDHNPFNPQKGTFLSVHDPRYKTSYCALKLPHVAVDEASAFCQSKQQVKLHLKAMGDRKMRNIVQGNDLCSPTKLAVPDVFYAKGIIKTAQNRREEVGKIIKELAVKIKTDQAVFDKLKDVETSALQNMMKWKNKWRKSTVVLEATAKNMRRASVHAQFTAVTIKKMKNTLGELHAHARKVHSHLKFWKKIQRSASKAPWQSFHDRKNVQKQLRTQASKMMKIVKVNHHVQGRLRKETLRLKRVLGLKKSYVVQYSRQKDYSRKVKDAYVKARKRYHILRSQLSKMKITSELLHKRLVHLTKAEVGSILDKSKAENKIIRNTMKQVVLEAKDCMGNHDWSCYKAGNHFYMARVNPNICEVECFSKDNVGCKTTDTLTECESAISRYWHSKGKPISCHGHYSSKRKPWCKVARDANDEGVDIGRDYENTVGMCNHDPKWQCLEGMPVRYNQKLCQPECSSKDGKLCLVENSQQICERKMKEKVGYTSTHVITCGGRQENDMKRADGIHHSRWSQAACTKIDKMLEIQTKQAMGALEAAVGDAAAEVRDAEKDLAFKHIERSRAAKDMWKAEKKLFAAEAGSTANEVKLKVKRSLLRPSKNDATPARKNPFTNMLRIKESSKAAAKREKYDSEITQLKAKRDTAKAAILRAQSKLTELRGVSIKKELAFAKAISHLNVALSNWRTAARTYSLKVAEASAKTEVWRGMQQKMRTAAIFKAKYALLSPKDRKKMNPGKQFIVNADNVKLHQDVYDPVIIHSKKSKRRRSKKRRNF